LSPFAIEVARQADPPVEALARLAGGRSGGLNGRLDFVAGDLCDETCCPGPYDVAIERRTLQLFPDDARPSAARAVAKRLASPGVFFCHCHDGRWKPPERPRNVLEPWFRAEGWEFRQAGTKVSTRVAWLFTTTG
jgi:hypothetical protein